MQEAITAEMPFEPLGRFAAAEIMGPIANRLSGPDRFERAALACSHVMGVLLARHFAGIPSLVDVEDERLIEVVGAVAQHYLTGDQAEPAAQATSA